MNTQLNWKKGAFSNTYKIFSNNEKIGELKNKSFSKLAFGEIFEKNYQFRTIGFFKQETEIFDREINQKIGTITYGNWKTKATINLYESNSFTWENKSSWKSKAVIKDSVNTIVEYKGNSSKGSISFENKNELLILTGLFIMNYYWQAMIAVMVAVFIPIWVTALN